MRVDATANIGTGHFMRCLTLAEELKKQGCLIRFVSRDLPPHLCSLLEAKGMEFIALNNETSSAGTDELAHSAWLGTSQAQDASETLVAIADQAWDWMVVDHYALDARWESTIRKQAKQIMAIDDIADRQHDCDVLLDQNYYRDMEARYDGKVPARCRMLLGPRYALLREEFRILRAQVQSRTGEVKRILMFFGGVDAGNYTGQAIDALSGLDIEGVEVDVVIGAQHPRRTEIEQACAAQGYVCHVQTSRMAELMVAADLAIGAGGTAIWERCCLGLPALSICVAENQRKQIEDAAAAGMLYAPEGKEDPTALIRFHAKALMENPLLLKLISAIGMKTVDGKGPLRVAGSMNALGIELRMAIDTDSRKLFEWRNHPAIRVVSRNSLPIAWEDHLDWFNSQRASKDKALLIGHADDRAVGVVRFDMEGEAAEISIYLVPEGGFEGQGRNLLTNAEKWLQTNRPDIKRIRANVLGKNTVSQRLFSGANYRLEAASYLKEI
ncbi:MAG: UDP-2,4-diacetamido-2,4,6-trideoxy-beta-L-altropyranose hydrolase [Pseudomonadota bacterium]